MREKPEKTVSRLIRHLLFPAVLIICLPLAGALSFGRNIDRYLTFPPKTQYVGYAGFSMPIFMLLLLVILVAILPFVRQGIQFTGRHGEQAGKKTRSLPWWGYAALFFMLGFWCLAWTRFEWFSALQAHTFFPLWVSFVFFVNSLVYKRTGTAPVFIYKWRFLGLFFASAAFWWFFEYLNRFVNNWYYTGSEYGPVTYFLLATLSFSTVLPAVESIKAWLISFSLFHSGFRDFVPIRAVQSKTFFFLLLLCASAGLFLLPLFPDRLFFLIWISPFLVIVSIQAQRNYPHVLSDLAYGDFTPFITYAAAALVCGFFWEMWNFFSLAKWVYAVPYVHAFPIFEMPVLGYAGYLPFGLECALVIDLVVNGGRN